MCHLLTQLLLLAPMQRWEFQITLWCLQTFFQLFYSVFFVSTYFWAASERRNRLPSKKVTIDNGINRRSVSNIFNCNQNNANKPKIAPKLKWKPIALKLNEKFETLTPILDQSMNKTSKGAAHNAVNISETKRDGRFSGSRNWWMISGRGLRDTFTLGAKMENFVKFKKNSENL